MSSITIERDLNIRRSWLHYGWVNVVIAAVAMGATFPGRTHGLGMFTQQILAALNLTEERTFYGWLNLGATLLGALFCLPIGWMIDRFGSRLVLTAVYAAFGASVLWLSQAGDWPELFGALILTRGLGQSALSVVSITLVAKWFTGRTQSIAMACYTVLMGLCFAGITQLVSYAFLTLHWDWRQTLAVIGWTLLAGLAPLSLLLTRSMPKHDAERAGAEPAEPMSPEALPDSLATAVTAEPPLISQVTADPPARSVEPPKLSADSELEGATLSYALRTPAFWVFSLAVSFYGLISSGIFLFNEEIFKDNHIDRAAYHNALILAAIVGVICKFAAAWLSERWGIHRLLALSLALMMFALLALPWVQADWQAYLYAIAMAVSGGVIALVFFAVWGQAFGRREVGRIQAVAQMLTVLASALGPLPFAYCRDTLQTYLPAFIALAPIALVLCFVTWCTPLPRKNW